MRYHFRRDGSARLSSYYLNERHSAMAGNDPKDTTLIARMGDDSSLQTVARELMTKITEYRYSYNFSWLGRPVIQYPQDLIAMQEIIWQVKPDLIIETGIAHGGSLVFYASMLELLAGQGQVLGIDIDIRQHNKQAIEEHPMSKRISMMQGSSIDEALVAHVREFARGKERVLVTLDSNHTHDHVLAELQHYAPLVTKDSYLVVFDTIVEDMPDDFYPDRPWSKGNNPKTAVREFMKTSDRFEIDTEITNKLLITAAPDGYLRCVK
jgi:cephalosporin hydroxylase